MAKKEAIVIAFIFIFLIGIFLAAAENPDDIKDKVDDELIKKADIQKNVSVMIKLDEEIESDVKLGKSKNLEVKEEEIYNDYVHKVINKKELEELAKSSDVEIVRESIQIHAFMQNATVQINATLTWPIQVSGVNITGLNQKVCVLDTGANFSHPDLVGKNASCIVDCFNKACVENCSLSDDNGHGTHVAGSVAASMGINGIAINASIIAVKVLDSSGSGSGNDNDISRAIDYCIEHNASVVSMSLGTRAPSLYSTDCSALMEPWTSSINNATSHNISVIAAAGNDGNTTAISSPACIGNVTAIGSIQKDDSTINYNRNSLVWVVSPGVSINSTRWNAGSCLVGCSCSGNYMTCSGTSMATPIAAGGIALIKQFLILTNQTRTPLQIKSLLNSSGKIIYDSSSGLNYSRINIYSAILSIDNIAPNVTLSLPANNGVNLTANQTFYCNATDELSLSNITLYIWNSSDSIINQTTANISGKSNSSSFSIYNLNNGNYLWNCLALDYNGNSAFSSVNYSIYIGGVASILNSPDNNNHTNSTYTNFTCQSMSENNSSLVNVTFYLWNSTSLIYNETKNISGISNSSIFNYSFSREDNYKWNCLSLNNNSNSSFSGINYSITYDITLPYVTIVSSSVSSSSGTVTFTSSENSSASINYGASYSLGTSVSNSSFSLDKTFVISSLSSSTLYYYNITLCDVSGSCNTNGTYSFTTSAGDSPGGNTGGSSGGGGSAGGSSSSSKSYSITYSEGLDGFSASLGKNDKINFVVEKDKSHSLIVKEVKETSVSLTINSDPINLVLTLGDSKKLNLTSADYYDLYIRLDSIEKNKSRITIRTIHENINPVSTPVVEENQTPETAELPTQTFELKNYYIYILIGVVSLIVIVILVLIFKSRKKKKTKKRKIKEYKEVFNKHIKPKGK